MTDVRWPFHVGKSRALHDPVMFSSFSEWRLTSTRTLGIERTCSRMQVEFKHGPTIVRQNGLAET